jgi:taurine dioxygenase
MPTTGGETHFCDMYGAYERLSDAWKARIAGLRAVHNLDFPYPPPRRGLDDRGAEARQASVDQPIVAPHPETDASALLGDHAEYIVACPTTRDAT